jgi:hypothetical protein
MKERTPVTGVATTAAARVRLGAIAHAKGAAMKIAPADLAATAEAHEATAEGLSGATRTVLAPKTAAFRAATAGTSARDAKRRRPCRRSMSA